MVDDMVADLEDEARAAAEAQQAEQDAQAEVDQGGAEVDLPEWFSEAQAELSDLYQEEQDPLLDAGDTDAVNSAPEEDVVEAPIAPETDVDPVGWEDVLAEYEAAEDALAADLMAGAEAWVEDVISAEELEAMPEPEDVTEVV